MTGPKTGPVTAGVATARAARDLAGSWLADRPRDSRGLPVPWINRWGAETAYATRISFDAHIGRRALFHDDHGDVPDFTRQNMGRQREAMMRGLCQVCGRFTPFSRRNVVLSGSTVEAIRLPELGGRAVAAVNEPWLDDRCAAIAALLCPALIRRNHDDDLHVVPVRAQRDVKLVVSVGVLQVDRLDGDALAHPDHLARLRAAAAGAPVGMWVKIILLRHPVAFTDNAKALQDLAHEKALAEGAARALGVASV